ncbi:MAG: phage tail sheath subtilisin-like domain-containing protein [Chloroflexi bacterium]|nr:phage tail sheath subtilisin-like domain-containing protein [Chloroflexota bacterium]
MQLPRLSLRDFTDALTSQRGVGLGAIRPGHEPGLLCAPDLMALTREGMIDMKDLQGIQQTMIDFCEYQGNCIAILDAPPGLSPQEVRDWRLAVNYDSSRAALYYPWLMDTGESGRESRAIPPSGHIAGIMMRTQIEHGIQKTPANEIVRDAEDLQLHVTREEQALLNPLGINLLQSTPAGEIRVWGARTLSSDSPTG